MRRVELIICSAFLAIIFSFSLAAAFDLPARGKWWHDEHMVSNLNLSKEQSQQIEEIFSKHRKEFLVLSALLKERYRTLDQYIGAQNPEELDQKKLNELVESVQDARTRLEKSRLIMLMQVRRCLSPEQAQMLQQMRSEMMRHMEQMHKGQEGSMGGMGMGQGRPMGGR